MEHVPSVLLRERCSTCDGTGSRQVERSAGHAAWSKTMPCPSCDGKGHTSRWVPLSELQRLLDQTRSEA